MKKNILQHTFIILFLCCTFSVNNLNAQFVNTCVDSFSIQSTSSCPGLFDPICGCNGITYRNFCFATNNGVKAYTAGPCENFAIDITPNVLTEVQTKYILRVNLYMKQPQVANYFIYDVYGNIKYQSFTLNQAIQELNVDLGKLRVGLYYFVLYVPGFSTYKKFLIVP
jgi:hypothetical protein